METLEFNSIYNMDCLEGLRKIEDNTIDCVVTSPPYNKGQMMFYHPEDKHYVWNKHKIDYDTYNDNIDEEKYVKWQIDILNEIYRVLKPHGSVFYNHKVRRKNNLGMFPKWVFETKLNFYQMIIWDRKCCVQVRETTLFPTTELVFWMCKELPYVYKEQAEFKSEIWGILPEKHNDHPAPFPLPLVKNCINLTTEKDDVVLDPFMGSGTTAVAAKNLGRKYIGFELSPNYVEMANNRLNGTVIQDGVKQENLF